MIYLIRQKFGRLNVQEFAGKDIRGRTYWKCLCDCGNIKRVQGSHLTSGRTQSCGCFKKEQSIKRRTTHGQSIRGSVTREYSTWMGMKNRCYNIKDKYYRLYGGRGIKVCSRWLESFENFYEDIGNIPVGMTLDRKDNDGNYEPGNWRFATQRDQANNRGNNHWIEWSGERKTVAQWERQLGMNRDILRNRIDRFGWSIERAMTTPVRRKKS